MGLKPPFNVVRLFRAACCIGILLISGSPSPGQTSNKRLPDDGVVPEPINLDIAPPENPDPEKAKRQDLGRHAAKNPKLYHDLLVQLEPDRSPREDFAALAIIAAKEFRRLRPLTAEAARAEAIAAQAILNPRIDQLLTPDSE